MYTIDFETKAIMDGDVKSPYPVGLAIKHNDYPSEYINWGHYDLETNEIYEGHQHTFNDAKLILENVWASEEDILCHNAKFDIRICMEWFDLPYPSFERVHDTMFMAFLSNPRSKSLSLKPLADKCLQLPPDEQTELKHWITSNIKKANEKNWGAYIANAPPKLAGKYAIGDTDRTYLLFQHFKETIYEK